MCVLAVWLLVAGATPEMALTDLAGPAAFQATMVKKTTRDAARHANNPKLRQGSRGAGEQG